MNCFMQEGSSVAQMSLKKIKINYLALHVTIRAKPDLIKVYVKVIASPF